MRRSPTFLPFLLLALLVPPASAAPPQPATLADAQAAFAAGDYRQSLQKIAGALSGPEGKAGSPTRYDLLVLRGECLLRLGERRIAADAFRSAATLAKSQKNFKAFATPFATALLISASRDNRYEPRNGEPIDIVDPQSRKRAFAAFYADTLATARPKLDQAQSAKSVKEIKDLLPTVRDLYVIEVAATGSAAQTDPLIRPVGQRARDLIRAQLAETSARMDQLSAAADEPVLAASVIVPRGLTTPERNDLASTADSIAAAERTAETGRSIAQLTDGPVQEWESILADCSELRSRGQQLWEQRQ